MSGKNVAIFRFELGHPSETFIFEQVNALRTYKAEFWARNLVGHGKIRQPVHLCDRFGSRAGKLFSVFPSPVFFHQASALKNASLVHAHFGPDAVYALPLAKHYARPLIATFHGYDVLKRREELLKLGGFRVQRFLKGEKRLQSEAAAFIAVSQFVRQALLSLGYPEGKIIQHYIGVDLDRFQPASSTEGPEKRYILSVGRHVEFKGIDTLLKAFAQVRGKFDDLELIQVGTGPLLLQNKRLADELGLSGVVKFLGSQPHAEVIHLMKHAAVFCQPSQTASDGGGEALGIVFCEASACGIPVASTVHGGIPEVVKNGETGLLAPERDPAALAENLCTLLSNPGISQRMGRAGRVRMERFFDVRRQTQVLETIYDKVCDAH